MNVYETHKPLINAIIGALNINSVFEFGCGFGSTPNFLEKCKEVFSIEMQSEEWYEKVKSLERENKHFTLECLIGPHFAIDRLKSLGRDFDLIFVDGHGQSRPQCINQSFQLAKRAVVTHDTETPEYGWENIDMPKSWTMLDYKTLNPWISAFFRDAADAKLVSAFLEKTL